MSDDRIRHKDLWNSIGNLKGCSPWIDLAKKLGLSVTQPKGGSSHYSIRLPGSSAEGIEGLITTVHDGMWKDVHKKAFKRFLDSGFGEDDIWKGLGMLK